MNTKESLIKDIREMGVKEGDTLFVRISYKAVGKTEGGPKTLIDAILSVIGDSGTVVATAFPRRIPAYKKEKYSNILYEKGMKPVTGIIPVIMSQHSAACFSSHPISPYVAIGAHAKEITDIHTPETDSYDVVKWMIEKYMSKCLRIGGKVLDGTTHLAFTEGLKNTNNYQYRLAEGNFYLDINHEKKWLEKSVSAFCYEGFDSFFHDIVYNYPGAILAEGIIGEGKAMLTDMGKTLEVERVYISVSPQLLLCKNPQCTMCRTSYSYSEESVFEYSLHQVKYLIKPKSFRSTISRIKQVFMDRYYGNKCQ